MEQYSLLKGESLSCDVSEILDDRTPRFRRLREHKLSLVLLMALTLLSAYSLMLTVKLYEKMQDIGRSPFSKYPRS